MIAAPNLSYDEAVALHAAYSVAVARAMEATAVASADRDSWAQRLRDAERLWSMAAVILGGEGLRALDEKLDRLAFVADSERPSGL